MFEPLLWVMLQTKSLRTWVNGLEGTSLRSLLQRHRKCEKPSEAHYYLKQLRLEIRFCSLNAGKNADEENSTQEIVAIV
jgi:hypothetical protein